MNAQPASRLDWELQGSTPAVPAILCDTLAAVYNNRLTPVNEPPLLNSLSGRGPAYRFPFH